MFSVLFRGAVIGFSIAAIVGPIGILCIQRSLTEGRLSGFVTGLGAATADAVYGFVAAFGLVAVSNLLLQNARIIELCGGAFLLVLAVRMAVSPTPALVVPGQRTSAARSFVSTFVLTLTNPMTILSFMGVFAGLGLGSERNEIAGAAVMVCGIFVGSMFWWLILSQGVGFLRRGVGNSILRWVQYGSALLVGGFGVAALWRVLGFIE